MIESPTGMSIMQAYEYYRNERLFVNRRYQRKLVWSLDEKRKLIDSILEKYPVPLILLTKKGENFEIIDGMQRLNALFGFIENEYSINRGGEDRFFNTEDYTFARTQIAENVFQPVNPHENLFLTQQEVSDFISYQFPLTVFKADDEEQINETFRRINSNGRHLSAQEVRQAGNTSQFADLVRELSSEIRGDASKNLLLLSQMPSISVDTREPLGYGVDALQTFWCSQGVLRISDLRASEDEQFLADVVLSIAMDTPFPASKVEFNKYYGTDEDDKSTIIEQKINALGKENIKDEIKLVFSEIVNFCETYLEDRNLKRLVNPNAGGNPIKEDFYSIFMAFHGLIIKESKTPFGMEGIIEALDDIHSRLTRDRKYTTTANRVQNISVCYGLLKDHFKQTSETFRSKTSLTLDFKNYLMMSKVEAAVYDYKQGLYTLSPRSREFVEDTFEKKVLHNIAALANLGKNKKGYLFIGVTDKEEDTVQVENLDGLTGVPRYHGFGIVGLEREAVLKGVDLDGYIAFITEKISSSELPSDLKNRLTKSITPITYQGYTVLMIEVASGNEPVYYKDKMFHRDGANCKEVIGAAVADIFKLFQ